MDVTREITLPVDPGAAWDTIVDLERWLTDAGSLELEPGAEGELVLRDGETRWATVADVCPGERLSWWWHAYDELATLVEVSLVAVDDGTRVVVVESGYAGTPVCSALAGPAPRRGPRRGVSRAADREQAVFAALADPTRRALLRTIAGGEASTPTELAARLPVSRQAVSKHLALLEHARLVDAERSGREVALPGDAGTARRRDRVDDGSRRALGRPARGPRRGGSQTAGARPPGTLSLCRFVGLAAAGVDRSPTSLRLVRRSAILLVVIAAVAAATIAIAQDRADDGRARGAQASALPAPDGALASDPARLAADLAETTRRLRTAVGDWTGAGRVPRDVTYLALHHQRILRTIAARRKRGDATLRRLPRDVRGEARDLALGLRFLRSIPRDPDRLPRVRVAAAEPAAELRRHYDAAQRRFGVHWSILAAVNFVESAFGRVRSASEAGARGPMQFLPSTWRQYGMGGDIDDPRDAILGAANYLRRSGARNDMNSALFAYNHSRAYVRAIRRFAQRMRTDPRAFRSLYAWQVYLRTKSGSKRFTGPGRERNLRRDVTT